METVGNGLTVTATGEEVPEQPLILVTVTDRVAFAVTLTACVVAPFDHKYEVAELDVKVTLPPLQKVVLPATVMVGVGAEFTVTVTGAALDSHPPG